jgi:hypothetical protein
MACFSALAAQIKKGPVNLTDITDIDKTIILTAIVLGQGFTPPLPFLDYDTNRATAIAAQCASTNAEFESAVTSTANNC